MKIRLVHDFESMVSVDNLLCAWKEFVCGKRNRRDVQKFSKRLMCNILSLHNDLLNCTYKHGFYQSLSISDPKPRKIHKATVRDRLLHHAIYRILYPFFDKTFIADSFSCRNNKGTHKAFNRFRTLAYKVSKNHTKTCWVLKCDIKKFFENIDHDILLKIMQGYVPDKDIVWLLAEVINSFSKSPNKGLPLGNLTSQLFANIYMNEFDQFIKHKLKGRYYIRYADDFVLLSADHDWLESLVFAIERFLENKLKLKLHPDKISIKTFSSGVDFLGWVHFTDHRVLRASTKKRMFKNLSAKGGKEEVLQSYLGLLSHGNTKKLSHIVNLLYPI